jgi:iron complex outermembrane receptor protein
MPSASARCVRGTACLGLSALLLCGQESPPAARLALLEQLRLEDILVTSVSKKTERAFEAPAAIYVITNDELRRSGVRTLPDALRLAPGVEVGQLDANKWAVSIRGFNSRFANKLLVLIDGRAIYTPDYSGVFWNIHNPLLADIDRIEVIRGPGSTLWGANAVNGVVNIITKAAAQTEGLLLTGGAGTEEWFGGARYGFKAGEHGTMRWFVNYDAHNRFPLPTGGPGPDDWRRFRVGTRADWQWPADEVTLNAEYMVGDFGQHILEPVYAPPYQQVLTEDLMEREGFALARWKHTFANETEFIFQTYYNHLQHDSPTVRLHEDLFDLDSQHRVRLPLRQELIYGLGYRLYADSFANQYPLTTFTPSARSQHLFSAFVHDEIALVEARLKLTLGTKLEHHEFTGLEVQPNARLLWTPHDKHTLWAAVSRAVRTPSRVERDVEITLVGFPDPTTGLQVFPRGRGSRRVRSEELLAYELGYRVLPVDRVSLDVAGYYFNYDRLAASDFSAPPFLELSPGVPHVIVPVTASNDGDGNSYGGEASLEVEVAEGLRTRLGYSLFKADFDKGTSGGGSTDPSQQAFLRVSIDLPHHVEVDLWGRYVDRIEAFNIGARLDADVRLAWKPKSWLEVAAVGRNLAQPSVHEFGGQSGPAAAIITEVPRGMYAQVTLRF